MKARWWMFGGDAPYDHDAKLDAAGDWPAVAVGLRSYRAQPVTAAAAPPGWMAEIGLHTLLGNIMPVSVAYVQQAGYHNQVNLPVIGPVDETMAQASALQSALAAQLRTTMAAGVFPVSIGG